MKTKTIILYFCGKAFDVGFNQSQKRQLTKKALFAAIEYFGRNGYTYVVWESYKAGLFAKHKGE